ncbi:MAG: hypothetical protein ACYDCK_02000 [Thermoplasmatota archaeon]
MTRGQEARRANPAAEELRADELNTLEEVRGRRSAEQSEAARMASFALAAVEAARAPARETHAAPPAMPETVTASLPSLREELARVLDERLQRAEHEWETQIARYAAELEAAKASNAELEQRLETASIEIEASRARTAEADRKMLALAEVKDLIDHLV